MCTHNVCFDLKTIILKTYKIRCILHMHDCVMSQRNVLQFVLPLLVEKLASSSEVLCLFSSSESILNIPRHSYGQNTKFLQ